MSKKNAYPYIDIFRVVASILVITIHTSPLMSISPTADFVLTRILGRVAVPFFFMTTSFFLFQNGRPGKDKFVSVLKQLLIIYGISTLIYVPVMIYNGYFTADFSWVRLLKDFVFDGTFYHLWYLPAVLLGLVVVAFLNRFTSSTVSWIIVVVLYGIGLGGDAYFGLVTQWPLLQQFYQFLFTFFDYTRNGLFFAPLYLWLGIRIAQHDRKHSLTYDLGGWVLASAIMVFEAFWIRHNGVARHDSMYISLPFVMYFLFKVLKHQEGKRHVLLKDFSLWVYILHPMMIIAVRLAAKIVRLESLLVANELLHFLLVTVLSCIAAYGISIFLKWRHTYGPQQ